MKDGFICVAAASPKVTVADCMANRKSIEEKIWEMEEEHAKIMVFPELCVTGYECRDLFWQDTLLAAARREILTILRDTRNVDALIIIGAPMEAEGKLYNVAIALNRGKILGMVPKSNLPSYNEFYENRIFTPAQPGVRTIDFEGMQVPFGTNLIFRAPGTPNLKVGIEICEDLWVPVPPSVSHCLHGATIICNLSASDELVGKDAYRRQLVKSHSGSCVCGYVYAAAGEGESTTDLVFGAHNMIAENGTLLSEATRFKNEMVCNEIDVDRITAERRRMTTYPRQTADGYEYIDFELRNETTELHRSFDPYPFVPFNESERNSRCNEILSIQSLGLKKRLEHTGSRSAVIGISGGLDSTLALLVTARAFDLLHIPRENICAVTMPCFGTTDRTYQNAVILTEKIHATLREINIREAVSLHFRDIGHDPENHNVVYENSQARYRTMILMNIANELGGLVIGTGDLSELALGWATYNGDHMSMYGVNASVPKTLVRHLVSYYAAVCGDAELSGVLEDILATPVSPELLPPSGDGKISQKTEKLVGPYELHDFFLYYLLRFGFKPDKIYRIACRAFGSGRPGLEEKYDPDTILEWLRVFCRRFFAQQYKRSALPDGPKVGTISVSPRGDLRMPSDASSREWIRILEKL